MTIIIFSLPLLLIEEFSSNDSSTTPTCVFAMCVQQNVELCDHRKVGQVDIRFRETGTLGHACKIFLYE